MIYDDPLLDRMRHVGDPSADQVISTLADRGEIPTLNDALRGLVMNSEPVPEELPDPVGTWLRESEKLPDGTDLDRLERGCELVVKHGPQVAFVLATASLVSCYAAYPGVKVLAFSQRLGHDPYRRLGETGQFVLSVTAPGALGTRGHGIRKVQKVRLLHAAVRHLIRGSSDWCDEQLGLPICQEDLAGTLAAFSWVVIESLDRLGIRVRDEEAADYLYLWRVIGELLGIEPVLIPASIPDAQMLAAAISRRNHRPSEEGVRMTRALLEVHGRSLPPRLHGLIPAFVRALVGDQVADWMQVPTSRWDKSMTFSRRAGRVVGAAQSMPGVLGGLLSQIGGDLLEERAVQMAGRRDASFSIPVPSHENRGWSPSGVFPAPREGGSSAT